MSTLTILCLLCASSTLKRSTETCCLIKYESHKLCKKVLSEDCIGGDRLQV